MKMATRFKPVNLSHRRQFGVFNSPVTVIDDAFEMPEQLRLDSQNATFQAQTSDYYPGSRAPVAESYSIGLCQQYLAEWQHMLGMPEQSKAKVLLSAYSITTQPQRLLKPIQMLPHFDTPAENQIAMVHFLCSDEHGGTGFFRHKSTQTERVTNDNLAHYGQVLKQQAIAQQLHLTPKYIETKHPMFESIGVVSAQFNRLVMYPSNLLHSGLINPAVDLEAEVDKARLTICTFVQLV